MANAQLKISGFVDYSEKENRLFSHWKKELEDLYRLFGFMGFNPRPVEAISSLQTKGGISHQIYTLGRLQDGSMTDLALPFDRTVPLAIYIASHRHELVYPFKRFDISNSFRGERPQAGRFRAFIQADVDVIDENLSPLSEIECLTILAQGLKKLSIPAFTIYLNHISIPKALIQEMGITPMLMPDALRIVDKMDKIGLEKVSEELLTLLPTIDLSLLPLLAFKGSIQDFSALPALQNKTLPGLQELTTVMNELEDIELFSFSPGMVRGLDYYTGLVYETFLRDFPGSGSISSGGRYNKLIDSIVNEETRLEGFGISIGLTRLFDVLKREKLLPSFPTPPAQVLVAYREGYLQKAAWQVSCHLRKEGLCIDLYSGKGSIGKQISYANKKEIRYVFMLMGETYVIKDLQTGKQTEDISCLTLATNLLKKYFS